MEMSVLAVNSRDDDHLQHPDEEQREAADEVICDAEDVEPVLQTQGAVISQIQSALFHHPHYRLLYKDDYIYIIYIYIYIKRRRW